MKSFYLSLTITTLFFCQYSFAQNSQPIYHNPSQQNWIGFYNSHITAKCNLSMNDKTKILNSTAFSKYSNCLKLDSKCKVQDIISDLTIATESACKQIKIDSEKEAAALAANEAAEKAAKAAKDAALLETGKKAQQISSVQSNAQNEVAKKVAVAAAKAATEAAAKQKAVSNTPSSPIASSSNSTPTQATSFGPFAGVQTCAGPGACSGTPAPPSYRWGIPVPFMNGPIDSFVYKGGFLNYGQPQAKCDASTQGQMMVLDFGTETNALICMGDPNQKMEDLIEKLKNVDKSKLKMEIAYKNDQYEWVVTKAAPPLSESDPIRVCDSGAQCNKETLGSLFGTDRCGIYKCVRIDGGYVKTKQESSSTTRVPTSVAPPEQIPTQPEQAATPPDQNPSPNYDFDYSRTSSR